MSSPVYEYVINESCSFKVKRFISLKVSIILAQFCW